MSIAIILLLVSGFCYTIYSKWQLGRNAANDVAVKAEQAKIETLKASIDKTQAELENAGKDYSSIYDAYTRKYGKEPRDPNSK